MVRWYRANPLPPHCGPHENGVTKDGKGCSVGPLFVNPLVMNRTPDQTAKEREQQEAQRKIYCEAHPVACNREALIHYHCRMHPELCFSKTPTQNLGTVSHSDVQWGDPETGKTYLIDPDTGQIIKEIGEAVQSPPDQANP